MSKFGDKANNQKKTKQIGEQNENDINSKAILSKLLIVSAYWIVGAQKDNEIHDKSNENGIFPFKITIFFSASINFI